MIKKSGANLVVVTAMLMLAPVITVADERVPHLDERGQAEYQAFLSAETPRAFVIAPGGTWVWHAEMPSPEMALEAALQDCRRHTEQRCVAYAVDDQVVFDIAAWPLSWGPYLSAEQANKTAVGLRRGQRFPDIVFHTSGDVQRTVSDLRGQVVVLHFWGSWCTPCQREMPDLQSLYDSFTAQDDVAFVLLPVRESFATAMSWATQKNIQLPIFSGGETTVKDEAFQLADGSQLSDRKLAMVFPTTYILDKHGVVVFSRVGPVARWMELAPFLRDAAAKSGQ